MNIEIQMVNFQNCVHVLIWLIILVNVNKHEKGKAISSNSSTVWTTKQYECIFDLIATTFPEVLCGHTFFLRIRNAREIVCEPFA